MIKQIDFIKSNNLHPLTLRFRNRKLEREFLEDYFENTLSQSRLAILLGCFAYLAFYFHDIVLMPQMDIFKSILRFGFIIPMMLFFYWISYKPFFKKKGISLMTVALLIIGSLSVVFLLDNSPDIRYIHFNDLMYIIIFTFILIKITFINALVVSTLLLILFQFTLGINNLSTNEILSSNYYLSFSYLFATLAGYSSELLTRKEFLTRKELYIKNEKSSNEALSLEAIVRERTKELLRLNKALSKAKLKAEGSDRLKSAFLANISHEIRTPLTQIIGFSELLAKANIDQAKRDKYVEYLDKNANKLLQIISDIIRLSEIETDQFNTSATEFSLKRFLDDIKKIAVEERSRQRKEHLNININDVGLDEGFVIYSDKHNLRLAFLNLINNAFKFTNTGEITVTYRIREDEKIEFCIKDTGKGIDEENTEMIFDHFSQEDASATREYGGTGLGLSITKGIVLRLGGKIWVKSKKHQGSSFFFTIPIRHSKVIRKKYSQSLH